ncbi:GSCFA domain-containing protein [Gelidibacter salicanalis]|uniref:GSCFA domain-containing protein n=1 Tax=Gelidibacter salicanalis TaxID=291193 RepID=A0A5C7AQZ8_9FLAO|nr:GSCFA domain-containing protein [Gelidibacter salicanalis]TXE10414.1 GSCFA domain-containing protein [Gelidibacter salicanalis]
MKLQTQIPLQKRSDNQIDYQSKVLLLGSCFVENIGDKLAYYKFQSTQNPFGVLFHPKAIEKLVVSALQEKKYLEDDVFFHNEQWHCYDAHSQLSNSSKTEILRQLHTQLKLAKQKLATASHVVITLGTAWVYTQKATDMPVANCHKVPQANFQKSLLSVADIIVSLQTTCRAITAINPTATIIFTVSPIRHIKDGYVENMRSKAHLIAAVHDIVEDASNMWYFPSYEIMMDELRDYRFYAEDMLHPNTTAIKYIWEKFQNVWMSEATLTIMLEVESIQKGLEHRPFNPDSERHLNFLRHLQLRIDILEARFQHIFFKKSDA